MHPQARWNASSVVRCSAALDPMRVPFCSLPSHSFCSYRSCKRDQHKQGSSKRGPGIYFLQLDNFCIIGRLQSYLASKMRCHRILPPPSPRGCVGAAFGLLSKSVQWTAEEHEKDEAECSSGTDGCKQTSASKRHEIANARLPERNVVDG
jgi:hypothetical protein